jgi:hypothetical protein
VTDEIRCNFYGLTGRLDALLAVRGRRIGDHRVAPGVFARDAARVELLREAVEVGLRALESA